MRTEASLRRLAEIGLDVYLPRQQTPVPAAGRPAQDPASGVAVAGAAGAGAATIVLLAGHGADVHVHLFADVRRALAFAGIAAIRAESARALPDEATALVVFGEAQVRAAGAVLSAQRQSALEWVVAGETHALRGDADARRALWSELKRLARALRARA